MIKFSKSTGGRVDGGPDTALLAAMAQQFAAIKASATTDLTDSSTGSADSDFEIVAVAGNLVNAAASGSDLSTKASAEAKLNLVKDALLELATQANTLATALGVTGLTYNGGGTAADGTIAAIAATTGGATGAQATETNATIVSLNAAFSSVAELINRVATATGGTKLINSTGAAAVSTVAAITVDAGTGADPGIKKTALDTKVAAFANNVATAAAALNAMTGAWAVGITVVD